jgi:MFS family permease
VTLHPRPEQLSWRRWVWVLTFIESLGTILLERAIYFFSHERLGYTRQQNLALALVFGLTYAGGAALSHGIARRLGDRAALIATLVALLGLHVGMAFLPGGAPLAIGFAAVGFFEGAKWPIVESYMAAGLEPERQLVAVGRFNVSWALAIPLGLAVSGPLIASGMPGMLFGLAAFANVLALGLVATLPAGAPHLVAEHPSRGVEADLGRYEALLGSSRWTMLSSYTLMFLLAPLLPEVFQRLGRPVAEATSWASSLDAVRVATFASLMVLHGWRGRKAPLICAAIALPLGFAAVLGGGSLTTVVLGQIVFGVLAGVTYHAALYYALVLENAAVGAGGGHERMIGLGLAIGPAIGLLGDALAGADNDALGYILIAALPLVFCTGFAALRSLFRVPAAERVDAGLSRAARP